MHIKIIFINIRDNFPVHLIFLKLLNCDRQLQNNLSHIFEKLTIRTHKKIIG